MLDDAARASSTATGVQLLLAHDVGQVRDTLRETRFEDTAGRRPYSTVDEAIRAIAPTRPARLADELIQSFRSAG